MPCTVEHEKRGTWHSVLEPNRYAEDADDVDVDGDDVDDDEEGAAASNGDVICRDGINTETNGDVIKRVDDHSRFYARTMHVQRYLCP